ncbi:hypothetical protein AUK40_06270 [Candidatus Wirthbacteria bacterium CG2_30_54_11]|uniref:Acetolactate synthase n=1 Tax=Candidatus Wirthbacteria bacterium CG2_30_54_11 TaxID=1817892 RepID=A0A1J5ISC0_9BACT|nr:MAG: hypothetical protein AUK40_06270 [Candidatus Wirthbacteria bacterium CG2_30_54_11]
MGAFDELAKEPGIQHIMPRHEQGAVFSAQGLSRSTMHLSEPQTGVCMATSGPGALNLVTGIADASMDSVPLMCITGQVSTRVVGQDAFQESDFIGTTMPFAKQAYMPLHAQEIERSFHEGLHLARTGRMGPVVMDVPKNVLGSAVPFDYSFDYTGYKPHLPGYRLRLKPSAEELERAVKLINASERPVIICGHGVRLSRSGQELLKFARQIGSPIAFTLHGLSAVPSSDPLSLGMAGMHGSIQANRTIAGADLIIALGCRFDDRLTGKASEFGRQARILHVEIDASEIDKNVQAALGIQADIHHLLSALLHRDDLKARKRRDWWKVIDQYRREMARIDERDLKSGVGPNGKLLMKRVIAELSKFTRGNDLIVSDIGQHQMTTARFYQFEKENSWFTSGGVGTMGCALPMSIGVALGRPDEAIWCIVGDGGLQMNLQELGTLMQYGGNIKIILLNNGRLGMVKQLQTFGFAGRYAAVEMQNPDFGKVSEGYGISYARSEKVTEISFLFSFAKKQRGACLIEFVCDPDELILPMIPAEGSYSDMITER